MCTLRSWYLIAGNFRITCNCKSRLEYIYRNLNFRNFLWHAHAIDAQQASITRKISPFENFPLYRYIYVYSLVLDPLHTFQCYTCNVEKRVNVGTGYTLGYSPYSSFLNIYYRDVIAKYKRCYPL